MSTVKYGNLPIDKIQFGKLPNLEKYFKFNFNKWIPTENLTDYEVSINKIIIKKFIPNKLLFRTSQEISGANNCEEVCNFCRGTQISVKGLTANKNLFVDEGTILYKHLSCRDSANPNEDVLMIGVCFYPYLKDGRLFQQSLNWWDAGASGWGGQTQDLSYVANLGGYSPLRFPGNNDHRFGIFQNDCENLTIFPNELYYWKGSSYNYYYGFGIYTSLTNEEIDISDNPITIELSMIQGWDLTTIEVWDVYKGAESIYHKDKTIQDAWVEHNIASYLGDGSLKIHASYGKNRGIKYQLHEPVDFDNVFPRIRYNCRPTNSELKDKLVSYLAENPIDIKYFASYPGGNRLNGMFSDSDVTNLTLTLTSDLPDTDYLTCGYPISGSDLETIDITLDPKCRISACQGMFYGASKLKTISYSGKPMGGKDVSGLFLGCGKLEGYPSSMIDWSIREYNSSLDINTNRLGWFLSGAHSITEVPSFTADRFSDSNTIVVVTPIQAFQQCWKLVKIGPILDLRYVKPVVEANGQNSAFAMLECPIATDVRIKNLNSGVWSLDGVDTAASTTVSNLSNLDYDSVSYLFENLMDLQNPTMDESDPSYPNTNTGVIYGSNKWLAHLQTYKQNNNIDLIAEASAKGWQIYLGRVLYTEVNDQ